MDKMITVPLPLNIEEQSLHLYAPFINYTAPSQKIKMLKNVFITSSGLAVGKNGLIKESFHDYPKQNGIIFREALKHIIAAKDDTNFDSKMDGTKTYLLIHHPWYNYYHWISESIFRLWMVHKSLDKLTLLLPEQYRHTDFVMGSIEPFNVKDIYFIPNGKSVFVKNLCLPQIKPICDSYNSIHVKEVRRFYNNHILESTKFINTKCERLYISRKYAIRRKVYNEDEIINILNKYNFTIFYPEKYNFHEQVTIFSQVNILVGEHGSGLTNMLFMKSNSIVLELHKNKTNELDHPSFLFWYLAQALEINYYHQSCETHGKEDYFEGDYIIEPSLFENNLIKIIKTNQEYKGSEVC